MWLKVSPGGATSKRACALRRRPYGARFGLRIRGPQPYGMGLKRYRPYGAGSREIRGMLTLEGRMVRAREETINVAEAKPPVDEPVQEGLGTVRGWRSDDDPFLAAVEEIVTARVRHRPRVLRGRSARRKQ